MLSMCLSSSPDNSCKYRPQLPSSPRSPHRYSSRYDLDLGIDLQDDDLSELSDLSDLSQLSDVDLDDDDDLLTSRSDKGSTKGGSPKATRLKSSIYKPGSKHKGLFVYLNDNDKPYMVGGGNVGRGLMWPTYLLQLNV